MTQRVIKFRRAYFNYDGSFYGFKEWGPNIEGGKGFLAPSYIHGCKSGADQQFTGLLDKHGKEIYEGDILKFVDHKHETRHIGPVVWGRYEMSGFDIPTWTARNGNRGGIGLFPVNFRRPVVDMEVIGNIYSNPELVDPKMITENGNS